MRCHSILLCSRSCRASPVSQDIRGVAKLEEADVSKDAVIVGVLFVHMTWDTVRNVKDR